jgi:hypothetical protein
MFPEVDGATLLSLRGTCRALVELVDNYLAHHLVVAEIHTFSQQTSTWPYILGPSPFRSALGDAAKWRSYTHSTRVVDVIADVSRFLPAEDMAGFGILNVVRARGGRMLGTDLREFKASTLVVFAGNSIPKYSADQLVITFLERWTRPESFLVPEPAKLGPMAIIVAEVVATSDHFDHDLASWISFLFSLFVIPKLAVPRPKLVLPWPLRPLAPHDMQNIIAPTTPSTLAEYACASIDKLRRGRLPRTTIEEMVDSVELISLGDYHKSIGDTRFDLYTKR